MLSLFVVQVVLTLVQGDGGNSLSINFNKELENVITMAGKKEPTQTMFLLFGIESDSKLTNEFRDMSFKDFNEPQFLFTNNESMPRRSSYAPEQKVAPVAIGKYSPSYLTVIVPVTTANFKDVTTMKLSPLVRTDYDIFIVVGQEQVLRKYFLSAFGMGLRTRLGVVYDESGTATNVGYYRCNHFPFFLVDPPIYNEGTMELAPGISNFISKPFILTGRKLKVAGNTLAPYILFGDQNYTKMIGGTHHGMLSLTAANYNFSLVWDIDPLRGNGKLNSDGNASGMLGEVLKRKADIAFIARLTKGQVGVIDLTTSNYIDTLVFLSRKPEAHLEWTAVIYIFTLSTWGTILLIFLGVIPIYCLQMKFAPGDEIKSSTISFKSVMIPFGILLTQSVPKIPKKVYLFSVFWMLYVLNLNIAYNCNLSSFLAKLSPEPVPTSFDQLSRRLDYNISFNYINNGSCDCFYFFNDSTNPMIIGIQERFMPNLIPDTGKCIVRAIVEPKNVCIGWESVTRMGIAQNATLYAGLSLVRVSASVHSSLNSIGFRRHSIYTRTFDGVFGRFRDMGIVIYLKRQAEAFGVEDGKSWLRSTTNSKAYLVLKSFLDDIYAKVKPFNLSQFQFAFILLLGGMFLSGVVCIGEIMKSIERGTKRVKRVIFDDILP